MNKSKFIQHKFLSKTNIALVCALIAVFGFLFSRAFLSFGVFAFGVNALRDIHPRLWLKNKWWLVGVVWVAAYALSWFWTEDKANWSERFDVKLPVLLLPLAFDFLPAFTVRQLRIYTIVTGLLLLVNVSYTLYFFAQNYLGYIQGYTYSKVLPALAGGDHIRMSLATTLFIIWCIYFWKYLGKKLKFLTGVIIAVLAIYLHILAARTGLLALYVFIFAFAIYIGIRRSRILGTGIVILLAVFSALAYHYSPTLKNRINYFRYTIIEYKRSGLQGQYSDMGRLISYDIAINRILANPLLGVGSGDVFGEMNNGYNAMYPEVSKEQRLYPHNQFLVVALACGVPVSLVFAYWVFAPVISIKRSRSGFFFFIVWLILLIPLMVEPMLEVQFGVFVYLFFLLWQRHAMKHEPVQMV